MTTIDLVGEQTLPDVPNRRIRYGAPLGPIGYRITRQVRPGLRIRRDGGRVIVTDPRTGHTGSGSTYLDAIQALRRAD